MPHRRRRLLPRALLSTAADGAVRFVVHDTGPGLSPAALERLRGATVPFASSGDGTGIGLFVIRDVLQQLGWSLEVQTRDAADPEGQGTTSTVNIPAMPAKRISAEDDLFEGSDALSALVVDDLSDVRDSLADVTRRLGHACCAVGSAAEARPLLASKRFDVALIDLEMPDTDGQALATEIRESGGPNTSAMLIPISAAENKATGQGSPFDGFLQKPFDGQALARLIGGR